MHAEIVPKVASRRQQQFDLLKHLLVLDHLPDTGLIIPFGTEMEKCGGDGTYANHF